MRITAEDARKVADAIRAAEATTDGEVNAVVARTSDTYADVVLHWALLAALLPGAIASAWPALPLDAAAAIEGGWGEGAPLHLAFSLVLVTSAAVFLLARLLFGLPALRMALTPAATKARRVRARAVTLFRAGTEQRTATRTGVLLYLSLAEHRAEIVADRAIHAKVAPELWGEAMAALIVGVRDGRPGDGIADAIGRIGAVLAEHFPHTGGDPNELPDRLIEL